MPMTKPASAGSLPEPLPTLNCSGRAGFAPLIEIYRFALCHRSGFNAHDDDTITGGVRNMARPKTGMTINKTRGFLYMQAKLLGDLQAARKRRVGKRIARRAVGRGTGKALGKSFR